MYAENLRAEKSPTLCDSVTFVLSVLFCQINAPSEHCYLIYTRTYVVNRRTGNLQRDHVVRLGYFCSVCVICQINIPSLQYYSSSDVLSLKFTIVDIPLTILHTTSRRAYRGSPNHHRRSRVNVFPAPPIVGNWLFNFFKIDNEYLIHFFDPSLTTPSLRQFRYEVFFEKFGKPVEL